MSKKNILFSNFLGGLAWGFGTVIGAAVIAAIVISLLKHSNFIPGFDQISNPFSKNTQTQQENQ